MVSVGYWESYSEFNEDVWDCEKFVGGLMREFKEFRGRFCIVIVFWEG